VYTMWLYTLLSVRAVCDVPQMLPAPAAIRPIKRRTVEATTGILPSQRMETIRSKARHHCAGYLRHLFTKSKGHANTMALIAHLAFTKRCTRIRKLKNKQAHAQWPYMHLHINQAER
jgi:hypothetical protein